MRTLKELLNLLLKTLEYKLDNNLTISGFCRLTTTLSKEHSIIADEMFILDEYIHHNMPSYFNLLNDGSKLLSAYGWKPGDLKSRREWLIKQLKDF